MLFTSMFENAASPEVIEKGARLAAAGDVALGRSDSRQVVAWVSDGATHRVAFEQTKRGCTTNCTCEDAGKKGMCPHVWALLVKIDGSPSMLAQVRGGRDRAALSPELDRVLRQIFGDDLPGSALRGRAPLAGKAKVPEAPWRQMLRRAEESPSLSTEAAAPKREDSPAVELMYVLDGPKSLEGKVACVGVWKRRQRKSGGWSAPKPLRLGDVDIDDIGEHLDRQALALLHAVAESMNPWAEYRRFGRAYGAGNCCQVSGGTFETLVSIVAQTGRWFFTAAGGSEALEALAVDSGPPWQVRVRIVDAGPAWRISAAFERGEDRIGLGEPAAVLATGWLVSGGRLSRFDPDGAYAWAAALDGAKHVDVPKADATEFLRAVWGGSRAPPALEWPAELRLDEVIERPRPCVRIEQNEDDKRQEPRFRARLSFDYGGELVELGNGAEFMVDLARRRVVHRDPKSEQAAIRCLEKLGGRIPAAYLFHQGVFAPGDLELRSRCLDGVVRKLTQEGWKVEAAGRTYRQPSDLRLDVTSGIDWFDLDVHVDFDGASVALPDLLAAVRRGEGGVALDDGTYGVLPEQWVERHGFLLGAARPHEGKLRFRPCQVALLDALLADAGGRQQADAVFETARSRLREFDGVRAMAPAEGFRGTLRPYQEEGLGWLSFLESFGFGGCLADDMGLGKTVQVLAFFASRKVPDGGERRASLLVVPRSLVFNWTSEARRFAPGLRVLEHSGVARVRDAAAFRDHDVVLTTYGTLRRDVLFLKDCRFDYVILDEAQTIKNAASDTAKAARLLSADHRLALTGTPIENHIGELWSLFEFLNPGILGASSAFAEASRTPSSGGGAAQSLLARALRPLILRRTKEAVAKDLPDRVEQTILCDLEPEHRRLYDELREHYRAQLLGLVDRQGLARSKIQVLEALLRLRQVACHPGLVDAGRRGEASSKVALLLERLEELRAEGHKVLVFSQFTSLLGIVRERLDAAGVIYAYLDGATRDRAARVTRFQEDPDCGLFLISLKAGGLGLNLTAAEYVFILDPWWNPAAEAQAVDRAHRIGQQRTVFAYRLIARDTVEEKVVELQERKRKLVAAVLGSGGGGMRDLSREDLEALLG